MRAHLTLLCALAAGQAPPAPPAAPPRSALHPPAFELVESAPVETTLDHPELRNADVVWIEMIRGAARTLEFAEFYASSSPGSRLEAVLAELEQAAARGVTVRFLLDKRFTATYPGEIERLKKFRGLELRVLDLSPLTRGILHAKYFVVDGEEVFIGSQNFDWRSLEHIQELGVRIAEPAVARAVGDVFALDWAIAGGAAAEPAKFKSGALAFPVKLGSGADELRITPVFSPKELLPEPELWDLLRIVELIDEARATVRVQVMTYKTIGRDKAYFDSLDAALRRAAARGVQVQLLCADWSKRAGTIEGLQSLEPLANLEVRMTTIPPWSGGFIPFARVSHAKYVVADGQRAWIGTSNWERDYFTASRNLGLIVEGASVGAQLDAYFLSTWSSPCASRVDPGAKYEAPDIDGK